jgi:hypothetical protein
MTGAAVLCALLCAGAAFASAAPEVTSAAVGSGGSLKITEISPKEDRNGEIKNVPIENVGIKLHFDGNVTDASVWPGNASSFSLADSQGNKVPLTVVPGDKENNYILVVASPEAASKGMPGQLAQKTDYTLTIGAGLSSLQGGTLGEDEKITFTTMDMTANSRISMILMVVMMVGLIVFMFLTNWRKMKAEAEAAALLKANPYRIAKDRGISVDDAKVLIEKAKEKNRKQLEKVGGKMPAAEPAEKDRAVPQLGGGKKDKPKKKTHKVTGPASALARGSAYAAARKKAAEKKARAEAAKKAARARQQGGGSGGGGRKSSKGKGKKK